MCKSNSGWLELSNQNCLKSYFNIKPWLKPDEKEIYPEWVENLIFTKDEYGFDDNEFLSRPHWKKKIGK